MTCHHCKSTRARMVYHSRELNECMNARACERRRFKRALDAVAGRWRDLLAGATRDRDAAKREHAKFPNERTVNAVVRGQARIADALRALNTIEEIRKAVRR